MSEIIRCPNCEQETYAGLSECPHCNNTMPPHLSRGAKPRTQSAQENEISWGRRLMAVVILIIAGFIVKVLFFG